MLRCVAASLSLFALAVAGAQETPAASAKAEAAKRRLELMQSALADCRLSSKGAVQPAALKLGDAPLLRYDDPTRGLGDTTDGLLDATVWRVGSAGRPTALVTLELYRAGATRAVLSYEFLSLTSAPLELVSPRGLRWTPSDTDFKLAPLPGAPPPADSSRTRLLQMRQLARRFAAIEEVVEGNKIECRLLTQPIDRYADADGRIVDGAIFVYANGTNPEAALFLECDEKEWKYGLCRLSSAALVMRLDGAPVWESARIRQSGATDSYAGMGYPIEWKE